MSSWEQSAFGSYNTFTPPWQLPVDQLPVCVNVRINDGQAAPMADDASVTTGLSASAYLGIYKTGNQWVGLPAKTFFAEFMGMLCYTSAGSSFITNGSTTKSLGVSIPTGSPSAATSGAGNITEAALKYYVSYVDSLGQESGLSAASSSIAATNNAVSVTAIPTSTGYTRKLYRSNASAIQKVTDLNETDTTYADNKRATELGDAAPETQLIGGVPPALSYLMGPHQGRLFGIAGDMIHFSAMAYPGIWHATNSIRWSQTPTAMASLGSSALVLSSSTAEFLDGSDAATFGFRRGDRYGTNAPHSVIDCGRYGVGYWSPRGLVHCDGDFKLLSDMRLADSEVATLEAGASAMMAGYWQDRLYLFHGGGGLVYDFKRGVFTTTDKTITAIHSNVRDNALYIQDGTVTRKFEGGTGLRTQRFRTRDHNPGTLDGAYHATEIAVEHSGDLMVRIYENGSLFDTQSVSRGAMGASYLMVPPGCWGPRQAVELEGTGTVRQIIWNPTKENR